MGVGSVVRRKNDFLKDNNPYESIECVSCAGTAIPSTTTLDDYIDGIELTILNVPVYKCVKCGEDFMSTNVMSDCSDRAMKHYSNTGETTMEYKDI